MDMQRLRRSTLLSVSLALLAAACDSSTSPADRLGISIAGTSFERGEAGLVAVPFEIVNEGARPLYVAACGDTPITTADRREDGEWVQHSSLACLTFVPSAPIELAPGERLEGTRPLGDAGRFRLRFGVAGRPSGETAWDAASGAFDVH